MIQELQKQQDYNQQSKVNFDEAPVPVSRSNLHLLSGAWASISLIVSKMEMTVKV
jgi:hypothetical protein